MVHFLLGMMHALENSMKARLMIIITILFIIVRENCCIAGNTKHQLKENHDNKMCNWPTTLNLPMNELIGLLKYWMGNDENTIKCYKQYPPKDDRTLMYDYDLQTIIGSIGAPCGLRKIAFPLILDVVKKRTSYPLAVGEALRVLGGCKNRLRVTLPIFKEWAQKESANWRERETRWYAAQALLINNREIDLALKTYGEIAEEGSAGVLWDAYALMKMKPWWRKGVALFQECLQYKNKAARTEGAYLLIKLHKEGAIKVYLLSISKVILDTTCEIAHQSSFQHEDERAMETIFAALKELKALKSIPVIEKITESPDYIHAFNQYAALYAIARMYCK